jgi:aldose 1-epimerase
VSSGIAVPAAVRQNPLLQLCAGDLSVELIPELGGSVASFRKRSGKRLIDLMRPLSESAQRNWDPTGAALFPMLPYTNRIGNNRFDFEGRTYLFEPNCPGQRFNLHGTGWLARWTVACASPASAELTLDHVAPTEPYSYSAFERFVLTEQWLAITLGITNRGQHAMPFGFGLHPSWNREPGMTLRFRSMYFWVESPQHIATHRISTPIELDFSAARPLPDTWRNNCYSEWDGAAEISFPCAGLAVRIEAERIFRHLMLYCDPDKSDFCLEPQTHAAGALNRIGIEGTQGSDLFVLQPGECVKGAVSFVPVLL